MPPPRATATPDLVGDVERFVQALVADLEPPPSPGPVGPGRPRVLPALALWAGLLVCVLRGWSSQRAPWRLVSTKGRWHYPRFAVSDQAVSTRLAEAGTAPLEHLFAQVSAVLAERLVAWPVLGAAALAAFATTGVAIDETTLDPVARRLRGPPPEERLPGTLAGVFDLRTQQWRTVHPVADAHQNEKVLARALVADLPRGSLILADLGYLGFAWFDDLTDAGQHWVSRLRGKPSDTVLPPH